MKKKKSESPKRKSEDAERLSAEKTRISTSNVRRFNDEAGLVFDPVRLEARPAGVASLRLFLEALFEPSDWTVTGYAMHETRFKLAGELDPPWIGADLPKGAWIKVNPVLSDRGSGPKGGVTDDDCIPRHVMLELDRCPLPDQHVLWSLLIAMGLPVVTLVHSRGKSLHAVLRVSARNLEAYRWAAAALCGLLLPFLPDTTSRNPSRFTRLPGFGRGGRGHQDLLYVNPDAPVWTPDLTCNAAIRALTAGLEPPPPKVQESMERSGQRMQREETEESKAEDKEFRKWASGLNLKGGLDMEHLVQAVGWKSCDAETVAGERKIFIQCPWCEEHSGGGDDDGDKDAYVFERKGTARFKWGFHCSHDSCQSAGRGIRDVFELFQSGFEAEFADSLLPHPDVTELFDEEEAELPQKTVPDPSEAPMEAETEKGNGTGEFLAMRCSEYADSELFRRLAGHKIRYLHDEGRWAIWKNGVWVRDKAEKIREMAKVVSKKRFEKAGDNEDLQMDAAKSGSTAMIDGVLKTVRSIKGIAATSDQFDRNPWLLGCQNGVLNLQTLEFGPGRPGDYVSLRCGAFYDPSAACPEFEAAVRGILKTNPEVVGFLQRWFGYSLTASDRDQFMVIFYGQGRNGKSTLLDAIRSVMGEYGVNSPKGLLIANPRGEDPDAATPSLMGLKGKRMACVSETEADSKLAESKVKAISGGEPVSGRRLHKDLEEFRVTAKVILSSNHIPRIAGTDTGIWRRILQVGFHENFEGRENTSLKEVLESEKSGILNWIIRGCLEWQERGLQIPDSVLADTKGLRESMDVLGLFLSQCCVKKEGDRAFAKEVYGAYKTWALESGVRPWSAITFNRHMKSRGWAEVKLDGYPRWKDLSLSGGAEVEL